MAVQRLGPRHLSLQDQEPSRTSSRQRGRTSGRSLAPFSLGGGKNVVAILPGREGRAGERRSRGAEGQGSGGAGRAEGQRAEGMNSSANLPIVPRLDEPRQRVRDHVHELSYSAIVFILELLCLRGFEVFASAGEFKPCLSLCRLGLRIVQFEDEGFLRISTYARLRTGLHKLSATIGESDLSTSNVPQSEISY